MNTTRDAIRWIQGGFVRTRVGLDYTRIEDSGAGFKLYIPKLKGRDRHLLRVFKTAQRAIEYLDEACRRAQVISEGTG